MSLLSPSALALLVLGVPIVLMYVLKLRRQDRVISTTFLWQRIVDDVQANTPWQRLRPNLLLLLQLFALGAIVLSLASPAYSRTESFQGDTVVIVDESYSMLATDVRPSRFAAAAAQAHVLAAQLGPQDLMSVIGMSAQPHLAIAASNDRAAIDHAIAGLAPEQTRPNFLAALSLASSLARATAHTRLVVLTSRDGGISGLPVAVSFPVEIERIGGRIHDLGITALSSARLHGNVGAVLRLHNFGESAASSDVSLFADGQLVDVRPVRVAAQHDQNLFWTDLAPGTQRVEARLSVRDNFRVDKRAWTALSPPAPRSILLVSDGNYFLRTALGLIAGLDVRIIPTGIYSREQAARFDAVIFDRFLPASLPAVPSLIVSPPAGKMGPFVFGRTRAGTSIAPTSSPVQADSAVILRDVDLSDVHVARVRSAAFPSWMHALALSSGVSAIEAGDSGRSRVVVVNFDLEQSDWPLRLSFPVTLRNIVSYLAPGFVLGSNSISVGGSVTLHPGAGTREVDVVRPDGQMTRLFPPFDTFGDTGEAGYYSVTQVGSVHHSPETFAANFFHPNGSPSTGQRILLFGHQNTTSRSSTRVPENIAWVFCAFGLLVLTGEWWFGFRR